MQEVGLVGREPGELALLPTVPKHESRLEERAGLLPSVWSALQPVTPGRAITSRASPCWGGCSPAPAEQPGWAQQPEIEAVRGIRRQCTAGSWRMCSRERKQLPSAVALLLSHAGKTLWS